MAHKDNKDNKDNKTKEEISAKATHAEEAQIEDILDENPEAVDDRAIEDLAAEELNDNDKLARQLDETKAALEKEKKEYLFLMADFDNFRKRVLKEKAELIKNGAEKALSGLLPVVDDFERGLKASENVEDAKAVREGMELIYQKFVKYLADNGVNIEYMYAFITVSGKHACVVLRIEDNDRATELLSSHGIKLVSEEDIKNL